MVLELKKIEDYDILLATDISWEYYADPSMGDRKNVFYVKLGHSLHRETGKQMFIPLKDMGVLVPEEIKDKDQRIDLAAQRLFQNIHYFSLVLFDLGLTSEGGEMLQGTASNHMIHTLVFHDLEDNYERSSGHDSAFLEGSLEFDGADIVTFSGEEEGLEKITNSVKRFYEQFTFRR